MDAAVTSDRFSRRAKIIAYVVAWLIALIATNPTAHLFPVIYMFPMGLAHLVLPLGSALDGRVVLGGSYGIYIVHAVLFFRSRSKRLTYIWFAVLAVLLICNVGGCRAMIETY
jgi:hypothetical protein